jgi:predicted TIM-barrel fold metal-dependent hydrolase
MHRIDVHHHFVPPGYAEVATAFLSRTSPAMRAVYATPWTAERSLEVMGRFSIAKAILSLSAPGVAFADIAFARKWSRLSNEYAAGLKRDHGSRFGFFATLPLMDVDASLKELTYALDELRADGIGLMTNYQDRWPGNEAFAPVFEELNKRKAIVYFHPTSASCCQNLQPEISAAFLEYPFDSTRAIASLLYSGAFTRHPDINFIFSHGGGALAAIYPRLLAPASQPAVASRFPKGALFEIQRQNYDLAGVTDRAAFAGLSALIPNSRLLFGTDFPFGAPVQLGVEGLGMLSLRPDELRNIEYANAQRLLRL